MECVRAENLNSCPCTYFSCDKRGKCCECIRYHRNNQELPACYFSREDEATYDRSIKKFVEGHK